mgnify:FL=1
MSKSMSFHSCKEITFDTSKEGYTVVKFTHLEWSNGEKIEIKDEVTLHHNRSKDEGECKIYSNERRKVINS